MLEQKVVCENIPKFCTHFSHLEHDEKPCYYLRANKKTQQKKEKKRRKTDGKLNDDQEKRWG